ncbi:MAG: c-type cytochrome [Alphaproteobacteria bacterium]|nr:c-type cytochrome [Alphaproteobacteria bacterium]
MRVAAALLLLAAPLLVAAGPPPGASACSGCHGAAVAGGIPPIAGRPAADLAAILHAFRDGSRKATLMDRLMKGFSDAEINAIAAYWASPS